MKKNFNILYITFTLALFSVTGCQDFEELSNNPNKPENVPPSILFNGVLNDLYERPWSLEHRQNQFWACNYNYYGTNEYWGSASLSFMTLKNIIRMEEEAARFSESTRTTYAAIAKFLKAYFYVRMTQRVGDLPLTDALKGVDVIQPAYNSQKDVYMQVFEWLEQANAQLASAGNLEGDIYYSGSPTQYRKAVNTFRIRVLVSLSKKADDTDLDIKGQLQMIMNDPSKYPLMTSLDDNLQYVYNGTSNLYPVNPGNRGFDKGRYNMADTYIGLLTSLNDPRVFVVANPAKKKIADKIPANDFRAYVGAPSGESLDNMSFKAGNGEYSFANQKRYYGSLKGPEPAIQIGYPELCFNIAEAINRGWISGDAGDYYRKGITASLKFFGIENGSVINITESDADNVIGTHTASVTNYLAQESVAYAGNNETGLQQILTQKYLAFFQNSGQEAYFNFRRTGVPAFHQGPGTGNGGKIPTRWLYPVSEATNNTVNYKAALKSQFGSEVESVNEKLWMDK
jgi:hypothetical protein